MYKFHGVESTQPYGHSVIIPNSNVQRGRPNTDHARNILPAYDQNKGSNNVHTANIFNANNQNERNDNTFSLTAGQNCNLTTTQRSSSV